jgi:heme-degrading monooxygenase HmoA
MIARTWHGVTPAAKADEYLDYLEATGLKELRATDGNRGVYVLRRVGEEVADFLLISLWDSYESIREFAGDEYESAVYYPEDEEFLLELEPEVTHYDVVFESGLRD